jgi:sodium-dependent dicarboxylate transporter 2/3/5
MTAIDTTPAPATTPSAVMRSFLPGIGIMTWKDAQPRIPYCSASASSVGTALLQTKGASWLAVVSFGFILVVNAPQNMLAYGTETFAAKDFVRAGLVLTIVAVALVMLLGTTYWHWVGYV